MFHDRSLELRSPTETRNQEVGLGKSLNPTSSRRQETWTRCSETRRLIRPWPRNGRQKSQRCWKLPWRSPAQSARRRSFTKAVANHFAPPPPDSIPANLTAFAALFSASASLQPWDPLHEPRLSSTSSPTLLDPTWASFTPPGHVSLDQPLPRAQLEGDPYPRGLL